MEDFATYILEEKRIAEKMMIVYYLSKKTGIYFDKSIVLRVEIAKLFIEYMNLDVDENEVLTAVLLCNCKKVENAQKMGKLETYAKEGAEYLSTLGFNKRFCKMCEEVNRYSQSSPRENESDILEVIDQFTGLILRRVDRPAFTTEEAILMIKDRNLKNIDNKYLALFEKFVEEMEDITIKDEIEVPVIKKLVHLHNKEANAPSFIATLTNTYDEKITEAIEKSVKKKSDEILIISNEENEQIKKSSVEKMKELVSAKKTANRALFSGDTARKILNHELKFKLEDEE